MTTFPRSYFAASRWQLYRYRWLSDAQLVGFGISLNQWRLPRRSTSKSTVCLSFGPFHFVSVDLRAK